MAPDTAATPEPTRAGLRPKCPTSEIENGARHTIIGCGSTKVTWDASDEVWDCNACGMFFFADAAEWVPDGT